MTGRELLVAIRPGGGRAEARRRSPRPGAAVPPCARLARLDAPRAGPL